MGLIDPLLESDWDRKQRSDYANSEKHTVVRLPCCGSSVEMDPRDGSDQYVRCPNRKCPKLTRFGGARHLITWGQKTKIQSERPMPEL